MAINSETFVREKLCVEFLALKHAAPIGVYLSPHPAEPLKWEGVFLPRKGPYAGAVLRFNITFSGRYPFRPPIVTLLSDVFHPMITPASTYTHTTRDPSIDTVSAGDEDRLPPGGLTLRHAFPEWFATYDRNAVETFNSFRPPYIVEVLQYLRIIFTVEEALDTVPVELAANNGAWHAWRSHRSKVLGKNAFRQSSGSDASGSQSPTRQQPGGARRPGEWNWQGVWEDRVRKSIAATNSEQALFVNDEGSVINFRQQEADDAAAAAA